MTEIDDKSNDAEGRNYFTPKVYFREEAGLNFGINCEVTPLSDSVEFRQLSGWYEPNKLTVLSVSKVGKRNYILPAKLKVKSGLKLGGGGGEEEF